VGPDGSGERRLTWTPQTEQSPAWSPDGSRIAYESDSGGRFRIWVMNVDGSGQTQISPDGSDLADDSGPAWSPDGTLIAFASTRGGTWNLWVMNADGSGLRQVSDVFGSDPAWSPNGRQLAYVGTSGIGVVGVDGSNPHLVSGPGAFASGPSWSPDGRQIVFSRNNAQGYPGELYLANLDGSGEQQLTGDGFENADASWSPDGTQIVFQRTNTPPFGWYLWAIGVDGSGLRQITSGGNELGPDWGSSQVVPDPSPPGAPTIQIYSPTDGAVYLQGMQVPALYLCSSYVSYVVSCQGDVDFGTLLDLSSAGTQTFTVRAVDADGRTATASVTYQVLDLVAPEVDLRTPTDGVTYNLGAEVTIDYSCSDPNGSGVAFCIGDLPSGTPLDTTQTGTHTFNVYALDNAGNFGSATATYTVIAPRQPQTISFAPLADRLVDKNNSAPDFNVSATASSSLAVSFASQTPTVCTGTVTGTVHLLGTGTCTIRAAQAGDPNFSAAPPVDQSFRVLHAVVIGPQTMDGDLKVAPGSTLAVGYDFKMPGHHRDATVAFTVTSVSFQVTCVGNSQTGTIRVPIATSTYGVPAGSLDWFPSGDQNANSVYQGSIAIPGTICGTGVTVRFHQGGMFTTGIASTDTTDKVSVRFHYSAGGSPGDWSDTTSIVPG
jgi:hypothetical protein